MKTKTKSQHTPGPWTIEEGVQRIAGQREQINRITIGTPRLGPGRGRFIACEINGPWAGEYERHFADARLIAAAPELLRFAEAIKDSVNDALKPGSPDTFMSLARRLQDYRRWADAAIAKAQGE